ncbi:anti-sigma factor family protein [Anaeromyxobacter sp. Red801]|uniref:anti-sigma factor family protein n=1 Tax=Anaeromyxobacter sp. Red801 TaxID=3411632 RepID=UPI003B9E7BEE
MTPTCRQIAEQASELLDGRLDAGTRRAIDAHLAGCNGCRAFVDQLEATRLAIGRLPPPEVPVGMRDDLLARFDALAGGAPAHARVEASRGGGAVRLLPWTVAGGAAMVGGLLVLAARHASLAPTDLVVSAGLAAAALALAATAHRFAARHAALGTAAAGLAALAAGGGGGLDAGEGALCVAIELGAAAAVGLLAWALARRIPGVPARRALAGGALAGALVADAALQVTCGANLALAHLAAFHLGGVAVVAAATVRLLRSTARAASA